MNNLKMCSNHTVTFYAGEACDICKLQSLLYDAIMELGYIQGYEDGWPSELIATARGVEIVEQGMKLLGVKDLSAENWKQVGK